MHLLDVVYRLSLIATLGVLIWYANETTKIRKISKEQLDLQLLPAMMLYIRRNDGSVDADPEHYSLTIRNVGNGTATTIKVVSPIFKVQGKKIEFRFKLSSQNNTLIADEERGLEIDSYIDGQSNYQNRYRDFHAYFSPTNLEDVQVLKKDKLVKEDTPTKNEITIKFKDIHGQAYSTVIGFDPSGISILKPPLRIDKF